MLVPGGGTRALDRASLGCRSKRPLNPLVCYPVRSVIPRRRGADVPAVATFPATSNQRTGSTRLRLCNRHLDDEGGPLARGTGDLDPSAECLDAVPEPDESRTLGTRCSSNAVVANREADHRLVRLEVD